MSSSSGPLGLIDYGMGNLHSVQRALERLGAEVQPVQSAAALDRCRALVLPGVGAFDPAMERLEHSGLVEPLRRSSAAGKPLLGICLGLQLLFEGSDEGQEAGLGIIPGWVRHFRSEPSLTIPHMGWNTLHYTQPHCPLWADLPNPAWAYFVHSYYVDPADVAVPAAQVTHGTQAVTAAIAHQNLLATQFHPEKSSATGLKIIDNFVALVAQA